MINFQLFRGMVLVQKIVLKTLILLVFCFSSVYLSAQEDLNVINPRQRNTGWMKYSDAQNTLYHHLTGEGFKLLDLRSEEVAKLTTPEELKKRQQYIRKTMWDLLGPFPEKKPLNAKITGKVKKDGYLIENVIYESFPDFYVTASLFIPDNVRKPAPAILFCSGHSHGAYRLQSYQMPLLNLVKKGFIVLAIDPIGQGERLQYFDPETGESSIGSSTKEHSYPSPQVSLFGKSVARYFAWDGIRGIDYLVSRNEVDPKRIGVHGLSGGGTQTAYISALDDRVVASAPAGYITSYKRLMEAIGVQDGEQNIYHGLISGLDHADYIIVRAPKPTLIMATTRDFFSIQGTRETYRDLKKIYNIFGEPGNIDITEDDHVHGYTKKNREAMYAFFQKHLMLPGSSDEEEVDFPAPEELQKTTTGQLATSLKGETVFSVNLKESQGYIEQLQSSRENTEKHLQKVLLSAQNLSGYNTPDFSDEPVFTGRYQRETYNIYRYFIKGEGDYALPYLIFVPHKKNNKALIYLHPSGKEKEAAPGGEIELFVNKGFTVLAPDLPGTGELGPGIFQGDAYIGGVSYNLWYTAMLAGRSIVGIQASDLIKLAYTLVKESDTKEIYGFARRELSPVLLHAAAFDPVFSGIALYEPYSSYASLVINRFYKPDFVHSLVPGALKEYDLPDLAACLAPVKLTMAGITDANGNRIDNEMAVKEFEIVRNAYKIKNATDKLHILTGEPDINPVNLFAE